MTYDPREREKIDHSVKAMWDELYSMYPDGQRTTPAYLVQWNRIHAYNEVWTKIAFEIPTEGRLADAAIDAKTSVRVLELVLEGQSRLEGKVDQLLSLTK